MVRQLAPTTDGLPLEIYCFTATTAWAEYEGIQADIFDRIFAIMSNSICVCISRQPVMTCTVGKRLILLMTKCRAQRGTSI